MSTRKKTKNETRLIVAASEHDPDMLYATRFFVPDPFIFLEQNGKRTIVLSDLEIDRARKQAKADEIVSFSKIEREVQGNAKKAPAYEKVMSHFLAKTRRPLRGCSGEFSARLRAGAGAPEDSGPRRPTDFSGRNVKPRRTRNCERCAALWPSPRKDWRARWKCWRRRKLVQERSSPGRGAR